MLLDKTMFIRSKFVVLLVFIFIFPLVTFAHGDKYLEFNPDATSSLKVSEVETPSQVFYAQNDFWGGFDVWVANPAMAGTATFTLLNEQGSVVSVRTVTIPTVAETANGTKLHVDLSSQLAVLSNSKYSIVITSLMPELRLYYSDRIKLVSYNSPFLSPYLTGVSKLGSEEQPFSFKYALYEITETSAPIISNIAWTVISSNEMEVNFNANEPIDYKIEYGVNGQGYTLSTNFLGDYQLCAPGISNCSLNIPVNPSTTYQYRLTVKDSWGNQSQATGTFTSGVGQTPAPTNTLAVTNTPSPTVTPTSTPLVDIIPPVISNFRFTNVTNHSVDIAWTTNEAANSQLVVISQSDLLTAAGVSDATFELEHLLKTGPVLNSSTAYIARITSRDLANNLATASLNFTTLGVVTTPTPTPSLSTPPPQQPSPTVTIMTNQSGTGSETVQWGAPTGGEPGDGYRIDVFDKNGNLVKTINVSGGTHSADVSGLEKGEYSVIVYSNNDGVFEKVDKPIAVRVGDEPFITRLLKLWRYLLIVVGLIAGFVIWEILKKKSSQPPQQIVS